VPRQSQNKNNADKSAAKASTVGGQNRSVRTTGKTGQAERDEAAVRGSNYHDPKEANKPWWKF
jgi:hypothetical protein